MDVGVLSMEACRLKKSNHTNVGKDIGMRNKNREGKPEDQRTGEYDLAMKHSIAFQLLMKGCLLYTSDAADE